jgi:hypothetical protein
MSDSEKSHDDERAPDAHATGSRYREPDGEDDAPEGERRRLFERAVPEVLRKLVERAVETGVETITEGPENIRKHLGDLKLPKEAAHYLYEQIDDTKKGLYRVVAKEIRDVLEHMSFADEIATVLTKLSFEINTQIRFVPNQAARDAEPKEGESADQPGGEAGSEGEAAGRSAPPGEPKRKSHFPRPQVVSKVVMKAVDMVRGKDKSDPEPKD